VEDPLPFRLAAASSASTADDPRPATPKGAGLPLVRLRQARASGHGRRPDHLSDLRPVARWNEAAGSRSLIAAERPVVCRPTPVGGGPARAAPTPPILLWGHRPSRPENKGRDWPRAPSLPPTRATKLDRGGGGRAGRGAAGKGRRIAAVALLTRGGRWHDAGFERGQNADPRAPPRPTAWFDVTGEGDTVRGQTLASAAGWRWGIPAPRQPCRLANVRGRHSKVVQAGDRRTVTARTSFRPRPSAAALGDGLVDSQHSPRPTGRCLEEAWPEGRLITKWPCSTSSTAGASAFAGGRPARARATGWVWSRSTSDASTPGALKGRRPGPVQGPGDAQPPVLAALRFCRSRGGLATRNNSRRTVHPRAVTGPVVQKGADYAGKELPGAAFVAASGGRGCPLAAAGRAFHHRDGCGASVPRRGLIAPNFA